jgi:hypothetical protein
MKRDGGTAWDWGRHATGWGTTKDGRGDEAVWARVEGVSRPWLADGAVEATAMDGWHNGSNCDGGEWKNVLQELERSEAVCLGWSVGPVSKASGCMDPCRLVLSLSIIFWLKLNYSMRNMRLFAD